MSPGADPQKSPLEDVYPPEVDTVLSSLASFKNLRTISVEFPSTMTS